MTKFSTRKLSLLGLVLMSASALTAAFIPSKAKASSNNLVNGVLQADTNTVRFTCTLGVGNCDRSSLVAGESTGTTPDVEGSDTTR